MVHAGFLQVGSSLSTTFLSGCCVAYSDDFFTQVLEDLPRLLRFVAPPAALRARTAFARSKERSFRLDSVVSCGAVPSCQWQKVSNLRSWCESSPTQVLSSQYTWGRSTSRMSSTCFRDCSSVIPEHAIRQISRRHCHPSEVPSG